MGGGGSVFPPILIPVITMELVFLIFILFVFLSGFFFREQRGRALCN